MAAVVWNRLPFPSRKLLRAVKPISTGDRPAVPRDLSSSEGEAELMAKISASSTTIRSTAIRPAIRATTCRNRALPGRPDAADPQRDRFPARCNCSAASRGELGLGNISKPRAMSWSSPPTRTGRDSRLRARAGRCRRGHLTALLARLSDRRAHRQGPEPEAGDHRRDRLRPCRPAGGDRPRDHRRRGHLLQLDQRRRTCGDDDPRAGPQLSPVVGPGEGRRLEHRRLRGALLRCRGHARWHGRRRPDRFGGAAGA